MAILDVGISASLTREIASSENSNKDKVSIFNTLETLYISITFISIAILFFLSPYIASNWLNVTHLELFPWRFFNSKTLCPSNLRISQLGCWDLD